MAIEKEAQQSHIINTLKPEASPLLEGLIDSSQIVVCDVDYTLLDVGPGHQQGVANLAKMFGEPFAVEFNSIYHTVVEGHRKRVDEPWQDREKFNWIMAEIKKRQMDIFKKYRAIKYWSKEAYMLIAAGLHDMDLSRIDVIRGRNAYWEGRKSGSVLYEDTLPFTSHLQQKGKPLFLMTGSYHIMQVGDGNALSYNPDFSEKYKRDHLSSLRLSHQGAVIGDPFDKPEKAFFINLFQEIRATTQQRVPMKDILVIGDSEGNDLMVPRDFGCTTLLLAR